MTEKGQRRGSLRGSVRRGGSDGYAIELWGLSLAVRVNKVEPLLSDPTEADDDDGDKDDKF